jgi:hypothetical protein
LSGLPIHFISIRISAWLARAPVPRAAVKDVGRYLMAAHGVSEAAMPMLTGLLFLPLLLFSVWLLNHLPPPTAADQLLRVRRSTMDGAKRLAFFKALLLGLLLLIVARLLTTAFRDFPDNYGVELFSALGSHGDSTLFTRTEIPVAFGVMSTLALLSLVRDNRRGVRPLGWFFASWRGSASFLPRRS